MISLSIHLYFNIHRAYYLFFKLHEIINKHVLAYACYYSFYNEILMIHVIFSKVQIFFKRYLTIYVILDFTPYEKNVSFQFIICINNTYVTQIIFSLFLQYLTYNTGTSHVIINSILIAKNSKLTAITSIGIPGIGFFFNGIR